MNLQQVAEFATEINEIALTEIKENKDKIKLEDTISEEDKKSGKYISLEKMVKTNEKLANTTIKIDKAEKDVAKQSKVKQNTQNLTYEEKFEMFVSDEDFFRAVRDLCGMTIIKKLIPQAIELLKKNDKNAYQNKLTEMEKFEKISNIFFEKVGIIEKRTHKDHTENRKNRKPTFDKMVRDIMEEEEKAG